MTQRFNWKTFGLTVYAKSNAGEYSVCEELFENNWRTISRWKPNDARLAYSCFLRGFCAFKRDSFAEAELLLKRAVTFHKLQKDYTRLAADYYNLGLLCRRLERNIEALKFFTRSLTLLEKKNIQPRRRCDILAMIGECSCVVGEFASVEPAFERAYQLCTGKNKQCDIQSFVVGRLYWVLTMMKTQSLLGLAKKFARAQRRQLGTMARPSTKKVHQVDNYFGTKVNDPYRWLENTEDAGFTEWLTAQNSYRDQQLTDSLGAETLQRRAWDHHRASPVPYVPFKVGDFYFLQHYLNKSRLHLLRAKQLGRYPQIVLDANKLPNDQDIGTSWISFGGKHVAYILEKNGSDWGDLLVKNIDTGKNWHERLCDVRHLSLCWKGDSSGFYYCSTNRKSQLYEIYFHKLGTPQSFDELIYKEKDADTSVGINLIKNETYLLLIRHRGSRVGTSVMFLSLTKNSKPRVLIREQGDRFVYLGEYNKQYCFITNKNAPMQKVVGCEIKTDGYFNRAKFKAIIPESDRVLQKAFIMHGHLIGVSVSNNNTILTCMAPDGKKVVETKLPPYTTLIAHGADAHPGMFLKVEGYTTPPAVYKFNIVTGALELLELEEQFVMGDYVTEERFARSKDGTLVPYHISYKKGLKRDGDNPVIVYGYGGFNISMGPAFDQRKMAWMDLGGACVQTLLRGGGEFGSKWRQAGARQHKQNTFDDCLAVVEDLIDKKYTRPKRLGIYGSSNGGLLAAACITQRPELFGAAVIESGLLDMLRYHHFDLARFYASEYRCSDEKLGFKTLYAYSPLHRLRKASYPPTLISVGMSDDRVSPVHSFKFAAAMQSKQTANFPIVLRAEPNAGHGGHHESKSAIDALAFLAFWLGLLPKNLLQLKNPDGGVSTIDTGAQTDISGWRHSKSSRAARS